MAVWILEGSLDHGRCAVLVDSVSGQAFGPMFADRPDAEDFLEWLGRDPRLALDLTSKVDEWRSRPKTKAGYVVPEPPKERWGLYRSPANPQHEGVWFTVKGGDLWEGATEDEARTKIESIVGDEHATIEVRDRLRSRYHARRLRSTAEVSAEARAKNEADRRRQVHAAIVGQLPVKSNARAELLANIATIPLQFETAKPEIVAVRMFFDAVKEYLAADQTMDGCVKILVERAE